MTERLSKAERKDADGNPISLVALCKKEPEWAANRIDAAEQELEQAAAREAIHVSELEFIREELAKHSAAVGWANNLAGAIDYTLADVSPAARELLEKAKERDALLGALRSLREKMKAIEGSDEWLGTWAMAEIHGAPYRGATWADEATDADEALRAVEQADDS